jgi:arylsulfatase A-like enzyme
VTAEGKDLVRWKYQRYRKDCLPCIAAVDDSAGRIPRSLGDHGLAKNTGVVYSSDQGFFLDEHGWFDKRWIYEDACDDYS